MGEEQAQPEFVGQSAWRRSARGEAAGALAQGGMLLLAQPVAPAKGQRVAATGRSASHGIGKPWGSARAGWRAPSSERSPRLKTWRVRRHSANHTQQIPQAFEPTKLQSSSSSSTSPFCAGKSVWAKAGSASAFFNRPPAHGAIDRPEGALNGAQTQALQGGRQDLLALRRAVARLLGSARRSARSPGRTRAGLPRGPFFQQALPLAVRAKVNVARICQHRQTSLPLSATRPTALPILQTAERLPA